MGGFLGVGIEGRGGGDLAEAAASAASMQFTAVTLITYNPPMNTLPPPRQQHSTLTHDRIYRQARSGPGAIKTSKRQKCRMAV